MPTKSYSFHKKGLLFFFAICLAAFTNLSAQQLELVVPLGHTDRVESASFSPDLKHVVTGSWDNTAKIWDAASGKLVYTLSGHYNKLNSVSFSLDGNYILTSSDDNTAKLWDFKSGRLLHNLGYFDQIKYSCFNPDGKYVTVISQYSVNMFNLITGDARQWMDSNTFKLRNPLNSFDSINSISCSNDGTYIAIAAHNNTISIFNTKTGKFLNSLELYPSNIHINHYGEEDNSAIFSPDGKHIIASSWRGIKIFDFITGKLVFDSKKDSLTELVTYSPDGKFFASTAKDYIIKIWDASTGKLIHRLQGHKYVISSIKFSQNGKYILTASWDKTAKIWDTKSGKLLHSLEGHSAEIKLADFSSDGKYVLTASWDNTAKIWGTKSGKLLQTLQGHSSSINSTCFNSNENCILTALNDHTAKIWSIHDGKIRHIFNGHKTAIYSAIFDPTGQLVATTGKSNSIWPSAEDNTAIIWNIAKDSVMYTLTGHSNRVDFAEFSPDGQKIVTTSWDNTAKVWNVKNGKLIYTLEGHSRNINSAHFSPNGNYIVTAADDGFAKAWNAGTGALNYNLKVYPDVETSDQYLNTVVSSANFSYDNNYLVTSEDSVMAVIDENGIEKWDYLQGGTNKIWDVKTGKFLKTLFGGGNLSSCFSPNGKLILTSSNSAPSLIWDADSLKQLHVLADSFSFGGSYWPSKASFSNDGKYVLTVSKGDPVKIWDSKTGKFLFNLKCDAGGADFASFSNAGNYIITINNQEQSLYNAHSGELLYKYILIDDSDFIVLNPENYYYCTKNAASKLSWRIGLKLYGFDQFDLKYNRPDLVLKSMGNTDTILINSYYKAYKKRIKRAKFTEEMLKGELHTPDAYIVNKDSLDYNTSSDYVNLSVHVIDSLYKLDRILVWVNDVPVYGINGISLRNKNKNELTQTFNIMLSKGENNVEVSCMNEHGAESTRESVTINYEPKDSIIPKVYFLGIGVQHFKDSAWNLTYSVKDIRDLSKAIKERYPDAIIDTLLNNNVTKENVIAEKQKLLHTNINDLVILSISGHGLLSDSLDFYYGSYDIDFRHPERRGISFDTIQWLLDSIPARNKLVLMDACHSGEVDKDGRLKLVYTTPVKTQGYVHEVASGSRGAEILEDSNSTSLQNSFDLMQQLFTDLNRGNGAIVISAAGGKEYAYESTDWNNGVFTYCVLKGLKDLSQTNADKSVTVTQLKNYVSQKVEELTGGKQKPTSRVDNLENDFKIW